MRRGARAVVAALWTTTAVVLLQVQLRARRLEQVRVPSARALRHGGDRVVGAVLTGTRSRCLVRALVLQEVWWQRDRVLDLVVGVAPPDGSFEAHSWLEDVETATPVEVVPSDLALSRFSPILRLRKSLDGRGLAAAPAGGP